jgi:peptidoglycan/LPS O-acetylase OafA/YrhL
VSRLEESTTSGAPPHQSSGDIEGQRAAPTGFAAPPDSRLRVLDALRLVAALAVVTFHFTARDQRGWGAPPHEVFPELGHATWYGYVGVHLFFVISGFVILMSVWGRGAAQFVASRISRLYPAFWVAVLLTATLRWLWPRFDARTPGEVLANLTMFHEPFGVPHVDGVYWTLWVEMQFYLLMLVLVRFGITVRRALAAATVVPLVGTTVALTWPGAGSPLTFLSWASMFGAGMVLHVIYRDGPTVRRWLLVVLNVGQGAVLAAVQKVEAIEAIATGGTVSPVVLATLVVLVVGVVALVTLVPAVRDVDWPVLTTLGALTYPLYLVHEYYGWALIQALHPVLGRWPTLVVAVGACCALAWAINRWVETPVQRPLRRRVEELLRRRSRPAA